MLKLKEKGCVCGVVATAINKEKKNKTKGCLGWAVAWSRPNKKTKKRNINKGPFGMLMGLKAQWVT